ncbi:MAG: glycosylhydrolase-like jelly roll fold domain-containing protein, partial [Tepidisphaeraceae bacterium]
TDTRAYLDLGAVRDVAEVTVNGHRVGIVWTAPFAADVTKHLKPGENTITIAVTNTWVNRMIGDEQIEPDVTYATDGSKFTIGRLAEFPSWFNDPAAVKNRKRIAFAMWKHWEKDSPLVESGLIGPVRVRFAKMVPLQP